MSPSREEVLAALRGVLDPELDESIVDLGFLGRVEIQGDEVGLELRLPTNWCAPNFSWLMAQDARQAALGVPGVRQATVHLLDHHAGNEISAGTVLGTDPLDKNFTGERSYLRIGRGNIIREHYTISRGTKPESATEIGDDEFERLMPPAEKAASG